ncbi:Prolipoprotein diacylglyceryl transferase [Pleurostoma richardsiae]|uniref:Prolipoprotein diacylglyceryl transferase n=1 Tax=Pleurostoma richardsiae TaxID=41990 RepID=A0AA38RF65_9PEZI|nr:Prolipoprotein diacylglyceryl transferase [Pleurostoma richardsiae]
MSLNGLDSANIREAHEAAVAEAGGWFLLKYASRDEVELLGRGNGGIVEIRNNISQQDETSPLYGFLRYRRRNVIIKFLPEDCSRLVQARVTVHFNSICDRFAPYDTTFSIAAAKELKDTKLSAACSLHTASGSTSSSTSSLRRRRLMEIAEEEEEEQRAKRQSVVKEEDGRPETADGPDAGSVPVHSTTSAPAVTLNSDLATAPEASQFAGTAEPPSFVGAPRPSSPAKSFDDTGRRMSSQTMRPDLYSYSSYPYSRPKVKLGPRPSLDSSGRPRTSAGSYRPVSTIPAGLKVSSKKRSQSQDKAIELPESSIKEEASEITFLATSIPIPEQPQQEMGPVRPHTSGGRPTTSSGASITSTMTSIAAPAKHNTMTREKARLMKAMQLREKKKAMALQPGAPSPPLDVPLASPSIAEETEEPELPHVSEHASADFGENRLSISKADSGIDVASSIQQDRISVDTQDDSHPASPIAASSEIGESTKASSFSESTDETVQAHEGKSLPEDEAEADAEEHAEAHREEQESTAAIDSPAADSEMEHAQVQEADLLGSESEAPEEEEPLKVQDSAPQSSSPLPISRFSTSHLGTSGVVHAVESETQGMEVAGEAKGEPAQTEPGTAHEENASRDSSASRPLVSKFSTQDLKSTTSQAIPSIVTPTEENQEADKPAINVVTDTESTSAESKRSKRRALIEPIKTDIALPDKEDSLSDDEDLMDELQSATVEEAKPVTVTMTPISPDFPASSPPKGKSPNGSVTPRIVRTVSNPVRGPLLAPGDVSTSSARAVSSGAAFLHKITQQQSANNLAPKTNKIGSSISQRIKALEMLSSSNGGGEGQPRERPSSTFFSVRKSSIKEPSRSPSVADRANSLTRGLTPSPPRTRDTRTREGSPEETLGPSRDRSASVASRLSMFEGGNMPRGRPESIQVTARIVRDPNQPFPKMPDVRTEPAEYTPLELRQSPLIVDHQKGTPATNPGPAPALPTEVAAVVEPQERRKSIQERRLSKDKRRSQSEDRSELDKDDISRPRRRSSLTIVRDFIKDRRNSLIGRSPSTDNLHLTSPVPPTSAKSPSRPPSVHQNGAFTGRLSISSRRSSISRDVTTPVTPGSVLSPSMMTESSGSGDEKKPGSSGSIKDSKSRASRFMRRLSSSLSSSRKNGAPAISPTVAEEDAAEIAASNVPIPPSRGSTVLNAPTIVAYMGDVNVQFPDNLLWKRRTMCLDSQGFLILSAVQGVTATTTAATIAAAGRDKQAGVIKRYHLSDFRQPYTPEMEVQELPNSVCLDFVEGSGLQIACEDRAGQLNVLHILQDAHQGHTSFGF